MQVGVVNSSDSSRRYGVFAALLLAGILGSCGSIQKPGIYQVGNWGPVRFLEDGAEVTLYTAQVDHVVTTSIGSSGTTAYSCIMTEQAPKWVNNGYDHSNARRLWYTAPAWRREENLVAVGKRLTGDPGSQAKRVLISSHNPVVVGMADEPDSILLDSDPFSNLLFFLSAGPKNLLQRNPRVTRLYVCRTWPTPDAKLGVPEDREVIVLPGPMSADEVMRTRPWEKTSKVAGATTSSN